MIGYEHWGVTITAQLETETFTFGSYIAYWICLLILTNCGPLRLLEKVVVSGNEEKTC